jgi:SAM-dependent methyltransferase
VRAPDAAIESWLAALEARHLAALTFPELRRAVQALSAIYVEERAERLAAALGSAGKRAAFALYYAPLHLLTVRPIVRTLGATLPTAGRVVDLGCGTGAAGAAWALECASPPRILGVDRSPWAASEATWTFRALGLDGRASLGSLERARLERADAIVAAWSVNELGGASRAALLPRLLAAHQRGSRVLVVEPVAKRAAPWWAELEAAFALAGGASRLWRIPADLPAVVARLDRATGLDHRELTARTLCLPAV